MKNNKNHIIFKLSITYDNGTTHYYDVITDQFYREYIEPIKDRIWEIECKSTKEFKKLKFEYDELNIKLKSYGRYCTDASPIYNSLLTQKLVLSKNQGGVHKVTTKKIQNDH